MMSQQDKFIQPRDAYCQEAALKDKPKSDVLAAVSQLNDAFHESEYQLRELIDRLGPVMSPVPEEVNKSAPEKSASCPLEDELQSLRRRAQFMVSVLERTRSHLCI